MTDVDELVESLVGIDSVALDMLHEIAAPCHFAYLP